MKKHGFHILVVALIGLLMVVSFYMLFVHVPYYQHHHELMNKRNEICESHYYQYMDYFNEYYGKETYYILKVKINDILTCPKEKMKRETPNDNKQTYKVS